ncbi:hypothetical protein IGI39_001424 [Enterococcus sp. AZ135]
MNLSKMTYINLPKNETQREFLMMYPIIICEDQIMQLHQLETIIQNFILFHSKLFSIQIQIQSPIEVEKYLNKFHPKYGKCFLDIDLSKELKANRQ